MGVNIKKVFEVLGIVKTIGHAVYNAIVGIKAEKEKDKKEESK